MLTHVFDCKVAFEYVQSIFQGSLGIRLITESVPVEVLQFASILSLRNGVVHKWTCSVHSEPHLFLRRLF